MYQHVVGRTPRLTAYFCGIAAGLALVVAGLEAVRILVVGELSPPTSLAYVALGAFVGIALSFVVGYLNGSILASWTAGCVPAAGRVGPPLAESELHDAGVALVGVVGVGVLLGAVGFAIAVEKHRRDALVADLPAPPARADLFALIAISGVFGGGLVGLSTLL